MRRRTKRLWSGFKAPPAPPRQRHGPAPRASGIDDEERRIGPMVRVDSEDAVAFPVDDPLPIDPDAVPDRVVNGFAVGDPAQVGRLRVGR